MPTFRLIYAPDLDALPMIDGYVHAATEDEARARLPGLEDHLLALDLSAKLGSETIAEHWSFGEHWVEALVERKRAGPNCPPHTAAMLASFERAHG